MYLFFGRGWGERYVPRHLVNVHGVQNVDRCDAPVTPGQDALPDAPVTSGQQHTTSRGATTHEVPGITTQQNTAAAVGGGDQSNKPRWSGYLEQVGALWLPIRPPSQLKVHVATGPTAGSREHARHASKRMRACACSTYANHTATYAN